jgi:hypothetical protein
MISARGSARYGLVAFGLLAYVVGAGRAEPFYLRYDADGTFPEEEGWHRELSDPSGELERSALDGTFHLNTLASPGIYDFYAVVDARLQPGPGEWLEVNWRMLTRTCETPETISDVEVAITNGDQEYAQFFLGTDFVSGPGYPGIEPHYVHPIEAEVWHEYSFVSADLETFELHVDGEFAISGDFVGASWAPSPNVAFGDTVYGLSSDSLWDFVEVRVVPEPSTAMLLAALVWLTSGQKRGERRC